MTIYAGAPSIGWGVYRENPWHFVALFQSQIEAAAMAIDMGEGYIAHYGEKTGKECFVRSDSEPLLHS